MELRSHRPNTPIGPSPSRVTRAALSGHTGPTSLSLARVALPCVSYFTLSWFLFHNQIDLFVQDSSRPFGACSLTLTSAAPRAAHARTRPPARPVDRIAARNACPAPIRARQVLLLIWFELVVGFAERVATSAISSCQPLESPAPDDRPTHCRHRRPNANAMEAGQGCPPQDFYKEHSHPE